MSAFDLNLLRVLVVLLDERNVTRAAERLNLSQPAVSAALSRLRVAFDDPLFVPARRGVVPTPRAIDLGPRAQTILRDAEAMVHPRAFNPREVQATFDIGVNDFGTFSVVTPLLERLRFVAPGTRLHLRRLDQDISRQLDRQEIDIAITLLTEPSKPAHVQTLFREAFGAVVRLDHPLIGDEITLDTFCSMDHVKVSAADARLRDPVDDALADLGQKRRIVLTLPSYFSLPQILRRTDLISVAPLRFLRYFETSLRQVHVPLRLPGFAMNMIWDDRTHASPSHRWLRSEIARLFSARLSD